MRVVRSLVFVTLLLTASINQVAAQDATPSAQSGTPIAISGNDCTITPRTEGAITEIVSATTEIGATPISEVSRYTRPEGTAADEETVNGVSETIRQLVACVNAGDYLRFLALFSNDALRRYAEDLDLPLEPDNDVLTPDPTQNDPVALGGIDDLLLLADGRVHALVRLTDPAFGGSEEGDLVLQLIFVRQGEVWQIDEFIPINSSTESSWTLVSGAGYQGVIVSAADAPDFVQSMTGEDQTDGWQPTPDDIAKLEAQLPDFLKTAPNAALDLWERVSTYLRQYAGVIDSDGRQTIFVNAFCDDAGIESWQSEAVLVMDGGDCFFTVTFNVETGTFTELMINGDA